MPPTELLTELIIDELWSFPRKAEPVRVGVPLPAGTNPAHLRLYMGDLELPLQVRPLAPRANAPWALLDFQADLDLHNVTTLRLVADAEPAPYSGPSIRVEQRDGLSIDTGLLQCRIPDRGELRVELMQATASDPLTLNCLIRTIEHGTLSGHVTGIETIDPGPLTVEVAHRVEFRAEGGEAILDGDFRLRFFAGKSHVECLAGFISRAAEVHLEEAALIVAGLPAGPRTVKIHGGKGRHDAGVRYDHNTQGGNFTTHFEDGCAHDYVAARTDALGLMGCIRKAKLYYPKAISAFESGLRFDLWPSDAAPYHFYPWMAMSNRVLINLFAPDRSNYELAQDAALFDRPIRPVAPADYYHRTGALGPIFPAARKYQSFECALARALVHRPRGTGQRHFGDEPNLGYTYSGRGKGGLLFTNGEYDFPHLLFMQYARTGARQWYEAAEAAALHWIDVDFLRDCANPRYAGGLACHEVDHRAFPAAGPSHEWVEGFLDYYHLSGDGRALECALSVADNVARYMEDGVFTRPGTYQMRELGWGLVALGAIYEETHDERFKQAGALAVKLIDEWAAAFGGLAEVQRFVDDPTNTDEPLMPLAVYRDNFHSITLNGLARFHRATGDALAGALFAREVERQLDWFNGPNGWAEQRETRYPLLEAFANGWRLTGRREYLDAGLRILEFGLTHCELRLTNLDQYIATEWQGHPVSYMIHHVEASGAQMLGLMAIPMLKFLDAAEEAGVLEQWFS